MFLKSVTGKTSCGLPLKENQDKSWLEYKTFMGLKEAGENTENKSTMKNETCEDYHQIESALV